MKKLENLIAFDDFVSNWKPQEAKSSKRTQTGLDILKENVEEIIPEGPIDDVTKYAKFNMDYDEKIEKIKEFINNEENEDLIDSIVNELRDVLLEMEQQGFVDEETTDNLDDEHGDDWISWIESVIELPDFPEEGLNNVLEIIENDTEEGVFEFDEDEDEDEDYSDEDDNNNIEY